MEMIYNNQVITMVCRALNLVDSRLIGHGVRVAAIMKDMLETEAVWDEELKDNLCMLSLLHDIGAYRLKEINQLIHFETMNIWEHSIYGYLFLKEFAPFGELAKVVLYHHADYDKNWGESAEILKYAQFLHVADRVEVWHRGNKGKKEEELLSYLKKKSGTVFSKEAVDCFIQANKQFETLKKLDSPVSIEEIVNCDAIGNDKADTYLWLIVHSIDFRSRFTVTHTVGVTEIGYQLAKKMGVSSEKQKQVYYGGMLHDLGKIGTPVAILEKPGKLTDNEMGVMKDHVTLSASIIENCVDKTVAKIALSHHEKLDGSGYPRGISGEELTLEDRILTIADIVSALSMSRSYKAAFPKEKVFLILDNMKVKGQIDGRVLEAMKDGYDDIIKKAEAACAPVRKIHKNLAEEYKMLLYKFKAEAKTA